MGDVLDLRGQVGPTISSDDTSSQFKTESENVEIGLLTGFLAVVKTRVEEETNPAELWSLKEWYRQYAVNQADALASNKKLRLLCDEAQRRVERRLAQVLADSDLPAGWTGDDPKSRNQGFNRGPEGGTKRSFFEGATAMQQANLSASCDDDQFEQAISACHEAGSLSRNSLFEELRRRGIRSRAVEKPAKVEQRRSAIHRGKRRIYADNVLIETVLQLQALAEGVQSINPDDLGDIVVAEMEPHLQEALKTFRNLHNQLTRRK